MADTNQVRVPPHSKEAEESVLGALLLDKDAVIAVAEFLLPEDFYDERHKEIYEAILSLYEDRVPVDVLTVTEKLKQQNQPILKTSIRKSNDGKWIIHETIIIDIKPIAYIEKCIA